MRINTIYETIKYNEHKEYRDNSEYKKRKQNTKDEQISFAEIFKREKKNLYSGAKQ